MYKFFLPKKTGKASLKFNVFVSLKIKLANQFLKIYSQNIANEVIIKKKNEKKLQRKWFTFCSFKLVLKLIIMEQVISIYEKLIIKEVTYETGDQTVRASCILETLSGPISTELVISHTDLNRIIAKIVASGFEFEVKQVNSFLFEDGTEVVDYSFENVFGEEIVLEDFQFQKMVQQIRA